MIPIRFLKFLFATFLTVAIHAAELPPLTRAHAHNDYEHAHPLFDALSHGFASVEADIWLVDGQLLVAHDRKKTDPGRTLQSLYLDPLRARAKKFGGKIYPATNYTFYLLIDGKSETVPTYYALRKVLQNYSDIITTFDRDQPEPKAVTVVLTGNRPKEMIAREPIRLAGVDGHLTDLTTTNANGPLLWISDSWQSNFHWRGQGEIPPDEKARLLDLVQKAHQRNLLLRFWATPDNTNFWHEFKTDGVDLLNADDLAGLEKFLRKP